MSIPKQSGSKIPLLGLGTWRLSGKECENTVSRALELGYRHIDSADVYGNHQAIGKAIQGWNREEIYLVSKVSFDDLMPEKVKAAVPRFLEELGTDYLDLLLIHWPNPTVNLSDTLDAMMLMQKRGLVRSIGVSNFVRSHLEILAHYPIVTNQIELHPYLQRKSLVDAYIKAGITITAYRPLAKGAFAHDAVLQKIGTKYGKSATQVALRFLVQQNIVVIPKAAHLDHLKSNLEIFDFQLSEDDMRQIDGLDQNKRFCTPENLPVLSD